MHKTLIGHLERQQKGNNKSVPFRASRVADAHGELTARRMAKKAAAAAPRAALPSVAGASASCSARSDSQPTQPSPPARRARSAEPTNPASPKRVTISPKVRVSMTPSGGTRRPAVGLRDPRQLAGCALATTPRPGSSRSARSRAAVKSSKLRVTVPASVPEPEPKLEPEPEVEPLAESSPASPPDCPESSDIGELLAGSALYRERATSFTIACHDGRVLYGIDRLEVPDARSAADEAWNAYSDLPKTSNSQKDKLKQFSESFRSDNSKYESEEEYIQRALPRTQRFIKVRAGGMAAAFVSIEKRNNDVPERPATAPDSQPISSGSFNEKRILTNPAAATKNTGLRRFKSEVRLHAHCSTHLNPFRHFL